VFHYHPSKQGTDAKTDCNISVFLPNGNVEIRYLVCVTMLLRNTKFGVKNGEKI